MIRPLLWRLALVSALLLCAGAASAQVIPPLGPRFEVDQSFGGGTASTAINPQGDFVVVFVSGGAVYGRLVSANGALLGPGRFQISADPPSANIQFNQPQVASALDGTFVVVWQRGPFGAANNRPQVFGRRFTTETGVPAPQGPAFGLARDNTLGPYQTDPYVSVDLNGNIVAFWNARETFETAANYCTGLNQIYCTPYVRGFDRNGVENIPETRVIPFSANVSGSARGVAKSVTTGRFMLLWEHGPGTVVAGDPCASGRACARLFLADGTAVGERFQPFAPPSGGFSIQPGPSVVAADFTGNFLFARRVNVDGGYRVTLRRFDRDGAELTPERVVDTGTAGSTAQTLALSAANASGNILIATVALAGSGRLQARWLPANYDDTNQPVVPPFDVFDTNRISFQEVPSIAMALDGTMLVSLSGEALDGVSLNGSRPLARIFTPPVEVRINDTAVSEGNTLRAASAFTVQLSRPHPSGATIGVSYETEADGDALAFVDYTPLRGDIDFAAGGPLAQPLVVQVIDDNQIEPDETFSMRLTSVSNAVIVRGRGVGTILNDDTGGVLLVRNVQRLEGDSGSQPLLFEVTLSAPQSVTATADYVTVDGSATAGSDYRAGFGTVSIPPGLTSAFVAVDVFGDTAFESDEDFRLVLSEPVGATIGPAAGSNAGLGTITSDDLCPLAPSISPASASFPVAGGSGTVAVTDGANCGWTASSGAPWLSITASPNCPAGSAPGCVHGGTGGGTVAYAVPASTLRNQRIGVLRVADTDHTVTQAGIVCNFTLAPTSAVFASSGGTGTFNVAASDPTCDWTAASQAAWLVITASPNCPPGSQSNCAHGGIGSGSVSYRLAINEDTDRTGTIVAGASAFTVDQAGFFFDDFDNGVLSPLWQFGERLLWTEAASRLTAAAQGGQTATAIARPAFAGCIRCTVTAKLRFDVFAKGTARLYAWHADAGTHVELDADEFRNTWTLRQRVAGAVVAQLEMPLPIVSNRDYTAELVYDGTDFRVSIDGNLAGVLVPAVGTTPDGTVGFAVGDHGASFDLIKVVTVTPSQLPPGDAAFADGFE